jgi:hypothetical protein
MSSKTTVAAEFDITGDAQVITVRKLLTPRGQLAEIVASSTTQDSSSELRIDALGLESLSWQTRSDLADQFSCDLPADNSKAEPSSLDESFEISNEYADAVVGKITTSDGDVIVVRAPVKKTELHLTPEMLSELARCTTDLFSEFLETPHGPHDH